MAAWNATEGLSHPLQYHARSPKSPSFLADSPRSWQPDRKPRPFYAITPNTSIASGTGFIHLTLHRLL